MGVRIGCKEIKIESSNQGFLLFLEDDQGIRTKFEQQNINGSTINLTHWATEPEN